MKIVNVMKHRADLLLPSGEVVSLHPCGDVATCTEKTVATGENVCGLPAVKKELGELTGLPEPKEGVLYYCNGLAFKAAVAAGRKDVVMGDSGDTAVRWTKEENLKMAGLVRYVTHLITAE